jgi:DNA-binding MarR family transcriptional regulator
MRRLPDRREWSFVSSHGAVLITVARHPDATVKEIADRVTLTERQAHRVLADLVAEGYVKRERVGRRNHYSVDASRRMRHPSLAGHNVSELLEKLVVS